MHGLRLLEDPMVREAIEILQESAFTKEETEVYDKYWDHVILGQVILFNNAPLLPLFYHFQIGNFTIRHIESQYSIRLLRT